MKSVPTLLWITLISLPFSTELLAQRSDEGNSPSAERPSGGRGGRRGARLAGSNSADYSGQSNVVARIKEEGLNHSEVMKTLSYLSDVIGPRLTGSPNLKRANEWTKQKLSGWGLTNAHLEAWGPFGRGWSLKSFAAEVIEPQTIPLIGQPNAWSP